MKHLFDFSYFPVLETERLRLREITMADEQAIFDLFSDPQVTCYNDVETLQTLDDAREIIDFIIGRFDARAGLRWGITLKHMPERLIGTAGYNVWHRHNRSGVIGYDLIPQYWGQGMTPEAVRAIIRFGFTHMALNRIEADVTVGNEASVRVLQKLGFTEEGLLRQRGFWKGKFHDLRFFSVLYEEFDA